MNDLRAIFINDNIEMKHKIIVDNLTQQSSLTEFKNKRKNEIF